MLIYSCGRILCVFWKSVFFLFWPQFATVSTTTNKQMGGKKRCLAFLDQLGPHQPAAAGVPAGWSWQVRFAVVWHCKQKKKKAAINSAWSCWLSQALLLIACLLLMSSRGEFSLTHSISLPVSVYLLLGPSYVFLSSLHLIQVLSRRFTSSLPFYGQRNDCGSTAPPCVSISTSQVLRRIQSVSEPHVPCM